MKPLQVGYPRFGLDFLNPQPNSARYLEEVHHAVFKVGEPSVMYGVNILHIGIPLQLPAHQWPSTPPIQFGSHRISHRSEYCQCVALFLLFCRQHIEVFGQLASGRQCNKINQLQFLIRSSLGKS
jgi:hypothetical protein